MLHVILVCCTVSRAMPRLHEFPIVGDYFYARGDRMVKFYTAVPGNFGIRASQKWIRDGFCLGPAHEVHEDDDLLAVRVPHPDGDGLYWVQIWSRCLGESALWLFFFCVVPRRDVRLWFARGWEHNYLGRPVYPTTPRLPLVQPDYASESGDSLNW